MFKDTSELAENKLLLLYILNKLPQPTSNSELTQIILENNLINYFALQQYISELIDNDFISDYKENKTHKLSLTEIGKNALEFFINRIPIDKLKIIDSYMDASLDDEIEPSTLYDGSIENKEDGSLLKLEVKKASLSIANFHIFLEDSSEAIKVCDNWKNNGEQLYEEILDILKK